MTESYCQMLRNSYRIDQVAFRSRNMAEASAEATTSGQSTTEASSYPNFFTWQLTDPFKVERYLIGLSLANCTPQLEQEFYSSPNFRHDNVPVPESEDLKVSTVMCCSLCGAEFETRDEQVQHYKADWHRYNLKQKICGGRVLSEQEFMSMIEEVSSISGSESGTDTASANETPESASGGESSPRRRMKSGDTSYRSPTKASLMPRQRTNSVASTDTEGEETDADKAESRRARMNPKVYLKNGDGQVLALYRCIVHGKLAAPDNCVQLISAVGDVPRKMQWAVLMVGGGHFAAAVFNGSESLLHKTFHSYTVRAKQGGSQSARDGKQKGSQPKSAGASLRRHNEMTLVKDIQDLLQSWSEELQKCSAVFYRAPGANRAVLFSGKNPPFRKSDPRMRPIPFPTNRATYKEVQRVHRMLCTVECFGSEEDLKGRVPVSPKINVGAKKPGKTVEVGPDAKAATTTAAAAAAAATATGDDVCHKLENISLSEPPLNSLLPDAPCDSPKPKSRLVGTLQFAEDKTEDDSGSDSDATVNWEVSEEVMDFSDLREFAGTRKPRKKKRMRKKGSKDPEHAEKPVPREFRALKTALFDACKAANKEALTSILEAISGTGTKEHETAARENLETAIPDSAASSATVADSFVPSAVGQYCLLSPVGSDPDATPVVEKAVEWEASARLERCNSAESPSLTTCCEVVHSHGLKHRLLNGPIGFSDSTLLHYCAKNSAVKLIQCLLEAGADPAVKNAKGLTPYAVCSDKQTRNEFRRFKGLHPEKYDYVAAQIPDALTEEMEKERSQRQAEKQREKRKLHREKLKERKAAEVQRQQEELEKKRFLSLSDREKRALAAERRFAKQILETNGAHVVLMRCFMCGTDITGKVPFEYSANKFCTMNCVKEHRKKPQTNRA
ncbi:ankyrin repeat and zinc finger domain-containing protein 1 isoform X1 [Rhipicephalus sanguineus]|uniref:ankyrin repeat and zinc finger domain-containing protein 1 isoform X1 n=1 Tax=Rhipicephalus sanguineus TaxID=34632 RepID=UPI0020C43942|nr:ankyrin repeat and zinc finger domain-containing protein 1 isoform X1 [Rhipicephalus sanguineus]